MSLQSAHAMHVHNALAYAGEISPKDAWEQLKSNKNAVLVDVRTPPEWTFSGEPDLGSLGKEQLRISWRVFPSNTVNEQFAASIKAAKISPDAPIFFICRTGGRSLDAACAITAEGYTQCYNVTDGFEGALNAQGHRGAVAGWKASSLPWRQA